MEHRLALPKSPQTNGMAERFSGRIEEVLQSYHFRSGDEMEASAAPLCLALQTATAAISLAQQLALAWDEGLAQNQA